MAAASAEALPSSLLLVQLLNRNILARLWRILMDILSTFLFLEFPSFAKSDILEIARLQTSSLWQGGASCISHKIQNVKPCHKGMLSQMH